MYKLIVIEDEAIEREGLVRLTDWRSLGIEVVHAACDGLEGYQKCCEIKPDIIIADIKMPGMNGLELLRQVKTFIPGIKSVIVSGFNDFEYAREAICLNASSYILKPFEESELIPVLQSIVSDLDRNRRETEERLILNNKLREYDLNARNSLILQIIQKKCDINSVKSDLVKWNIPLNDTYMALAALKISCSDLNSRNSVILHKRSFEEVAKGYLNDKAIILDINEELTGILFISAPPALKIRDAELFTRYVRKLLGDIQIDPGFKIRAGVGCAVNNISLLHGSYNEALAALCMEFHMADEKVVSFDNIKIYCDRYNTAKNKVAFDINNYKSKILFCVKSLDKQGVLALQAELLNHLEMNYVPENDLKSFFSKFIFELSFALYEMNEETGQICGREDELSNYLNSLCSFSQLRDWFNKLLLDIFEGMEAFRTRKSENVVQKVIDIIKSEYMNGISIRTISDSINISPNYLGAIFRKSTGKNFNEYLTELRMEKAKVLIRTKKYKIAQVGEMVGIPNESYFCVVFKNVVGISPGIYQEVK